MTRTLRVVALAAALATAGLGHAATQVTGSGFTIAYTDGYNGPAWWDINLLSRTADTTRISLDNFASDLRGFAAYDATGAGLQNGNFAWNQFGLAIAPGYRIVAMSLGIEAEGTLQIPDSPLASGSNRLWLEWDLTTTGPARALPTISLDNFTGVQAASAQSGPLDLTGTATLDLRGGVLAAAQGVPAWPGASAQEAFALADLNDAVLTIQVAQVPEPATWSMLAAGAAVAGLLAHRRRRRE